MKLIFSIAAEFDLEAIGDAAAIRSPFHALRLTKQSRVRARELTSFPDRFRKLTDHEAGIVRLRIVGSHLIVYQVQLEKVVILRIVHGATDWERLLTEGL